MKQPIFYFKILTCISLSFFTFSSAASWHVLIYLDGGEKYAPRIIKQIISSQSHLDGISVQLNRACCEGVRYHITPDGTVDKKTCTLSTDNSKNLVDAARWAFSDPNADQTMLVVWSKGYGILDPFLKQQNCLNNHDLAQALRTISKEVLQDTKITILGFDASYMAMIEIADLAKDYAHVLIAPQEVQFAIGWNYKHLFSLFNNNTPAHFCDIAQHIVATYKQMQHVVTDDYTLSALDLSNVSTLEDNVAQVACLLSQCMQQQSNNSVKKALYVSKEKSLCTHFDEPSYIDLDHFYANLEKNLKHFSLKNITTEKEIKQQLKELILQGRRLIKNLVFANATGQNLRHASGLSIYFPEGKIHSSYSDVPFALSSGWLEFLQTYLTCS